MKVELRNQNWLFINGELMTVDSVSPLELERRLNVAGHAIKGFIQEAAEGIAIRNPKSADPRPWLHTIKLGERGAEPTILTDLIHSKKYEKEVKTLHYSPAAIVPELRDYWQAVVSVDGLFPRVQSNLEGWDARHDGTWLQIRDEPFNEVNIMNSLGKSMKPEPEQ